MPEYTMEKSLGGYLQAIIVFGLLMNSTTVSLGTQAIAAVTGALSSVFPAQLMGIVVFIIGGGVALVSFLVLLAVVKAVYGPTLGRVI